MDHQEHQEINTEDAEGANDVDHYSKYLKIKTTELCTYNEN